MNFGGCDLFFIEKKKNSDVMNIRKNGIKQTQNHELDERKLFWNFKLRKLSN